MGDDETLATTSGFNHAYAEHNLIFSIVDTTGSSAGGDDTSTGLIGASAQTTIVPFDLSTDTTTTSRRIPDDDSSIMASIEATHENPDLSTATLGVVGTALISAAPVVIVIIFEGNAVANSAIEKRAYYVKSQLEGEKNPEYSYPALVCKTHGEYEVADALLHAKSLDKLELELTAVKAALERMRS